MVPLIVVKMQLNFHSTSFARPKSAMFSKSSKMLENHVIIFSFFLLEVGEFEINFIASRVSNRLRVLVLGSNSDEESLPAES